MAEKDTRLVYSTDPALNRKCTKCKELLSECTCRPEVDPKSYKFIAVLRIEKQGRSGKTVTVIDRLPKNELFLKTLTTTLKKEMWRRRNLSAGRERWRDRDPGRQA